MGSPVLQFGKPEKALLGLAVASLALSLLQSLSPSLLPLLQFALALLLILGGLVVTHRLIGIAQWAARKLLWRVRHRMVAVFFFVGVLPISLGGLLVIWGILLLLGPLTAYMITTQFTSYGERLQATAGPLLWQLQELPASARPDALARFHASASKSFPGLAIRADFDGATQTYPEGALTGPMPSQLLTHPAMVRMENGLFLPAVAHDGASGSRLVLAVPVTAQLVHEMMPGLGVLAVEFDSEAGDSSKPPRGGFQPVVRGGGMLADNGLPAPRNPFDWQIAWPIETLLLDWRTDKLDSAVYLLRTRPSALWGTIFAQESERTFGLFSILGYCLMAAFGANLLISLFVAISLTRTLTRALNDLYVGTTHVNRGDFSYRIPVSGNDQVSDLSRSFNAMTGSIKRLIEDSKQRQQLEAELEIAREVQARLFPANPPQLAGLEVLGVCRPARSVSGDFFDYVQLNDDLLALSFGDVSGKGISAALVMATLHSIVRTQLSLLHPEGPQTIEEAAALLVERANRQLYEGTAPEKYSTLFFAAFDQQSGMLAYSNAGHLPPLLLRNGGITALEVNGLIVGALPHATYSATTIPLQRGDMLVAFTDGVTEPENEKSEEYGLPRLQQALQRAANRPASEVIECVMDDVLAWTGKTTLQDDMTMLVMRRR